MKIKKEKSKETKETNKDLICFRKYAFLIRIDLLINNFNMGKSDLYCLFNILVTTKKFVKINRLIKYVIKKKKLNLTSNF